MQESTYLGVELLLRDKLNDVEYANNISILGGRIRAVQYIVSSIEVKASQYGMQFALNMCRALIQQVQRSVPALNTNSEQLQVVDSCVYLRGGLQDDGTLVSKISSMGWHLTTSNISGRGMRLDRQQKLVCTIRTSVLRAANVKQLLVFDHCYPQHIVHVK